MRSMQHGAQLRFVYVTVLVALKILSASIAIPRHSHKATAVV
jgi:hypothetical protein